MYGSLRRWPLFSQAPVALRLWEAPMQPPLLIDYLPQNDRAPIRPH